MGRSTGQGKLMATLLLNPVLEDYFEMVPLGASSTTKAFIYLRVGIPQQVLDNTSAISFWQG